ncbi:MAG: L-histidine N(alpha)-methyltransferase [Sulfuriferula sp.]
MLQSFQYSFNYVKNSFSFTPMLTSVMGETSPAEFIQSYRANADAIRELSAGLLAPQAFTSPKYLYDALGSKLFEAICELPEYYPTRTEAGIFSTYLTEIAQAAGLGVTLIDLGAGNCAKAAQLFSTLQPAQYVPVDVSVDFLRDAVGQLRQRFPQLDMIGLGMDFTSALDLPDAVQQNKRLFFYPGASIGNFTPNESVGFLRRLRAACGSDGGVLIGVDLIKDKATLDAAYDDALGVTAAFNLNLLQHLNQLLGADFNVRDWRHLGFFNTEKNRIEMYLEARSDLNVTWPGALRRFVQGERIHTENSYKYLPETFLSLLAQAGFGEARLWTDAHEWFAVIHARAV